MLGDLDRERLGRGFGTASLILAGATLLLAAQPACGGEDQKKKAPYQTGGQGGAGGSGGKAGGSGGGGLGGSDTPNAGSGGGDNLGGETSDGGANSGGASGGTGEGGGGAGGADGPSCAPGTADCDNDPNTCEADITTLTQCGACNVACDGTNGTVICGTTGCEMTSCNAGFGDCNETGTDGCETPLNTTDNCGICDHGCNGAACTNSLCAGTTLGSGAGAYRWAMSVDAIYRLHGYTPDYGLARDYTLVRTPLDGSAEVIVHTNQLSPGSVAVDGTNVYWSVNGTPPAVFYKAHTASAATTPTFAFEPGSLPVQMRFQGTTLYWMGLDGAIYSQANPTVPIVTASEVRGAGTFNLHQDFVTTPTVMYWVVPTSAQQALIRTAPLAGGTASDVPGAVTNPYFKLFVAGEDLYWIRATGAATDGAWHFVSTGTAQPLVIQSGLNAVMADGAYLYLLGGYVSLYRAPIAGGASVKLGDCSGLAYCFDFLGSDPESVYATTSFTHGAGFFGAYPPVYFPK
jgi:hypothetical protein